MSAARKLNQAPRTAKDIEDFYYLTINEICQRTTYDRKTVEQHMREGKLKSEKKNGGKRVVKVSDFVHWWKSLD